MRKGSPGTDLTAAAGDRYVPGSRGKHLIRPMLSSDAAHLVHLAQRVFGVKTTPALWVWKYFGNPWGPPFSYIAMDAQTDMAVGFWGASPWRFSDGGTEIESAIYTDLMVDPDWRRSTIGLTLYRQTVREANKRAALTCGFANSSSIKVYQALLRPKPESFPLPRMDRILTLRPFWTPTGPRDSGSANAVSRFHAPLDVRPIDPLSPVFRIERFDEGFEELWRRIAPHMGVCTVRSRAFLQWRFQDRPDQAYVGFGVKERGRLAGYVVITVVERDGLRRGQVMDLLVDPAAGWRASWRLLRHAIRHCRAQGADLVTAWCPVGAPAYCLLLAAGFIPRRLFPSREPNIFSHAWVHEEGRPRMRDLRDSRRWYLTIADSDDC